MASELFIIWLEFVNELILFISNTTGQAALELVWARGVLFEERARQNITGGCDELFKNKGEAFPHEGQPGCQMLG